MLFDKKFFNENAIRPGFYEDWRNGGSSYCSGRSRTKQGCQINSFERKCHLPQGYQIHRQVSSLQNRNPLLAILIFNFQFFDYEPF